MSRTALSIFALLAGLLLAPLSAWAEPVRSPAIRSAIEQNLAEAATLFSQGNYQGAYELYSRLLRENPDDDAVNLGLARSAMLVQRPNQAVMAYERLLELHPDEPILYKEIAQAYMALGYKENAEKYLQRGAGLPPEESTDLLKQWDKRYDRLQVHGKLRAGAIYDSNANLGPASNTLSLGNFSNVVLNGGKEEASFGGYLGGQIDIGYRLEQASPWWAVGDAHFYFRGNTNNDLRRTESRTSEWARAGVGVRYLTSSSLFDARLKAEIFDYEFKQNVTAVGPELLYVYAVRPDIQLIAKGGVDRRTYSETPDRNGIYGYIGPYARFFFGEKQHEFLTGVRYLGGAAKRNDYTYNGWEALARFTFKLPYGFEFTPHVVYGQELYNGPGTVLETKDRRDDRFKIGAGLVYRFNEAWSVEAMYQFTRNDSKSNLYQYDQHMTTLGVAWDF